MEVEEVRSVLVELGYEPEGIQLEQTPNRNVGGFVVSAKFDGMDHLDRQQQLWAQLEKRMQPEQLQHIVSILTMTPEEVADEPMVASG